MGTSQAIAATTLPHGRTERSTNGEDAARPARRTAVRGGGACTVRSGLRTTPVRSVERPAPLRLTRRGRAVLVVLPGVLALVALLVVLLAPVTASGAGDHAERAIVVHAGDRLWGIAERIAPNADPREIVAGLRRANHLAGDLRAGARLVVPVHIAG